MEASFSPKNWRAVYINFSSGGIRCRFRCHPEGHLLQPCSYEALRPQAILLASKSSRSGELRWYEYAALRGSCIRQEENSEQLGRKKSCTEQVNAKRAWRRKTTASGIMPRIGEPTLLAPLFHKFSPTSFHYAIDSHLLQEQAFSLNMERDHVV